ncbi:arsenate reductase ArsC [Rubrobacter indicoceani]|uniref:arsenate reductase ArsC n=1 Tax=Rubrobacter indicoceani TaxID=2051957 RepID=UPI000E5BE462|nr:arsenate reductase ArsC [Rubrobacter indicoceani]
MVVKGSRKQRVLFLCTQNSARSQMAEALLRHHAGDRFEAYSAGVHAADEIHPHVERVLSEVGVSMAGQRPKPLGEYFGKVGFNYLVIVCARAERECPVNFPGVGTRFSWIFDDPRGASVAEEDRLEKFRKVRDGIELRILDWLDRPETELAKLRREREVERAERLA